jgi:hypothetical protein
MRSRAVPDQHRLHIGFQRPGQLGQKHIHDARVEPRRNQPFGLARLGAGRRQDVDGTVLRLTNGTGTRPGARPDASQRPLLTEPRFVFVEDFEPSVGVFGLDFLKPVAELFLNSSCAAGSDCGCCGLGTSDESPSRCNRP